MMEADHEFEVKPALGEGSSLLDRFHVRLVDMLPRAEWGAHGGDPISQSGAFSLT